MMNSRSLFTLGGLVLAVLLFFVINLAGNLLFSSSRLDLTENRLYTLSEGSRNILRSLDEPVTLRFYLSRDLATLLPGINTYAGRVEELLQEFVRESGGVIDLRVIEPEAFSEAEDEAVSYGLEGIPLGDGENIFYFGLVASGALEQEEVIPFFTTAREAFLEYDLARLVFQVSGDKGHTVGLISSLPVNGMPQAGFMPGMDDRWIILDQIEQFFELETLPMDSSRIPDAIDVLMVVHPGGLGEETLYAIEQFVLAGGKTLMFLDPYAETDPARSMGGAPLDSPRLAEMLNRWGVEMPASEIVADINLASRVQAQVSNRNVVVDYPVWMNVGPGLFDRKDVITAELGDLFFASAGALGFLDDATTRVTPLITTTVDATLVDPAYLGPDGDPVELIRGYQGGGQKLNLAARIQGEVDSAWTAAPSLKPDSDGNTPEDDRKPHLAASTAPINVVLVSDSDILQDRYWVQAQHLLGSQLLLPTSANDTLVINALENLTGDENLIGIRSRGSHARPFTLLDNVRRNADLRYRQKEQELLAALDEAERRLSELQRNKSDNTSILSAEQLVELERFRDEKVKIRKELRDVRHSLREDIESIQSWIRFMNIALVPLIILIAGAFLGVRQMMGKLIG